MITSIVAADELRDLTKKITPELAHNCVRGLLDSDDDRFIDWAWVYHNTEAPMLDGIDCRKRCSKLIKDYASCCHGGSGIILQYDESESGFLGSLNDVGGVVTPEGYVCDRQECYNRKTRPFWCRTTPFGPLLNASGNIIGVVRIFDSDEKHACPVLFEEVTLAWKTGFLKAWTEVLGSLKAREAYCSELLDIFDTKVYGFDKKGGE